VRLIALAFGIALVAACGTATLASPTPNPSGSPLTMAQLKYRIVDRLGRLVFCDPDYYPVARADEQSLAQQRLPDIAKDAPTFAAITAHLALPANPPYTPEQELAIYRDSKMLTALRLDPVSAGFHFSGVFGAQPAMSRVDGSIDASGSIALVSQTPSGPPPCPICLARGTLIATPSGDRAVESLAIGDVVWTVDATGARVAAPLVAIGSTPVPPTHQVVHLVLSDGRAVDVSPGHPTADGRVVGALLAGDRYDGATLTSAERIAYPGGATFDVLPAGSTGEYWANGVLLASTLRKTPPDPR
jgi:Hint domain-containing protein